MLPDQGGKITLLKTSNDVIFPRQISNGKEWKATELGKEEKREIELGDEDDAG